MESEGKLARVISKKPTWEVGAVQGIKKKTPAAKPTWTVEGLEDDVLMVYCLGTISCCNNLFGVVGTGDAEPNVGILTYAS